MSYEERVYIEEIKARFDPAKFSEALRATHATMVMHFAGITDFNTARMLSNGFAKEAYADLTGKDQPLDSKHFESDNEFVKALTNGIIARAQEYQLTMESEYALRGNDGKGRGQ
jgi:hypothetical protein